MSYLESRKREEMIIPSFLFTELLTNRLYVWWKICFNIIPTELSFKSKLHLKGIMMLPFHFGFFKGSLCFLSLYISFFTSNNFNFNQVKNCVVFSEEHPVVFAKNISLYFKMATKCMSYTRMTTKVRWIKQWLLPELMCLFF